MGLFVVLVVLCTFLHGWFWYESEDAEDKPKPSPEVKGHINGGFTNGDIHKMTDGLEMSEVCVWI